MRLDTLLSPSTSTFFTKRRYQEADEPGQFLSKAAMIATLADHRIGLCAACPLGR